MIQGQQPSLQSFPSHLWLREELVSTQSAACNKTLLKAEKQFLLPSGCFLRQNAPFFCIQSTRYGTSLTRKQAPAFVEYTKRKWRKSWAGGDRERKHRCFGVARSRCYRVTAAELFCVAQTLPEPLQFQQKTRTSFPQWKQC